MEFTPPAGGGGSKALAKITEKRTAAFAKSNAARVAAVDVRSSFTLPDEMPGTSMSRLPTLGGADASGGLGGMGRGGGMGSGVGMGFGSGEGGGMSIGASVRFFDQEVKAQRIAYVIDFSKSMKGRREELMRAELEKSVSKLSPGHEFQLIFFAGPAWVAGWGLAMEDGDRAGTVTSEDGVANYWSAVNAGDWERSGGRQQATWKPATKVNVKRSVSIIHETPLVFGTYWKPALDLALEMTPPPDIIYFMTDGVVSKKVYETIDEVARTAKRRKTVINTIAMMEPAAADAMGELAKKTGGKFTMIQPDGSTVVQRDN